MTHVIYTMANNSSSPFVIKFAELSEKSPEFKLSFVALFPTRPKMLDDMERRGCDCYWVKFDYNHRKTHMIRAFFSLYGLFKRLKPDIVHTMLFDDSLPGLLAARLAGIKIRIISKCDAGFHHYFKPIWKIFDRLNNILATHIIAISDYNNRFVQETENPDPGKLTTIHWAVDVASTTTCSEARAKKLNERFGLKEDEKLVIKVARFIPWKGFQYLIQAVPEVLIDHPKTKFLLVGYGEDEWLKSMVERLNITENVIFSGWIEREDLNCLYKMCDVYVHAASIEPFGGVIAEAMFNGAPMVCTPSGAAKDCIKHKVNGFMAKLEDPHSIAEGIKYVLENDIREMAKAGQKTALASFTIDKAWNKHVDFYKKAMSELSREKA